MSSLPPNAPPLDTSSTVMRSASTASTDAIWSRSSQTPWPPEYTCMMPPARGTARVHGARQHVAVETPHRVLVRGDGVGRIGDGRERCVLDLDQRRRSARDLT